MKSIKLALSVGMVIGSFSFCNAQNAVESAKPIQQKMEITKDLEERVRNGATRFSTKKVQPMTVEQAKKYSAERHAELKAKGMLRKEADAPQNSTN